MQKSKRWAVKSIRDEECGFPEKFDLSPVMCNLLKNRGIYNEENLQRFIHPKLEQLYDPYLLPDMEGSVKLIKGAIDTHKRITIYGDYDADGVTSTSVLYKFLRSISADVGYYIPNRFDEGYGLNVDALNEIINSGSKLIITVDCGVSSIEEVKHCRDAGIDIIITDHHECGPILPDTLVINPKRQDSVYPFKELAGVGVAFKLIEALAADYSSINTYEYLDLVSIGTVADIVPVLDENRILVKCGLELMKSTKNFGIKALVGAANLLLEDITSRNIGYVLAPRINAAGRMGSAAIGVELFATEDETLARDYALKLCDANKIRQEIEEKIFNEAEEMLKSTDNFIVVLESEGWHVGVIGIVASKLTEKYCRPVVLLSRDGENCRGSARSIPGFNIYEGFSRCSDLLIKFGGHEQAAGLSMDYGKVEEFRERINFAASKMVSKFKASPVLNAECSIESENISLKLVNEIMMLEPCGMGNPVPVFIYNSAFIDDIRTVGVLDKHLKIRFKDGENTIDAIAFNMGYNIDGYKRFDTVDVACTVNKNTWNGREDVQLIIKDMRKSVLKDIEKRYLTGLRNHMERFCKTEGINIEDLHNLEMNTMDVLAVMEEGAEKPGALVLLSNFQTLEHILEYNSDIDLYFESNCNIEKGRVAVVVCPDIQSLCYEGIDRIYIMDNLVDYKMLLDYAKGRNIRCYACTPNTEGDQHFIKSVMPLRSDMESIYLYLKHNAKYGCLEFNLESLARALSMDKIKAYFSVRALSELDIFTSNIAEDGSIIVKFNPYSKNPMKNSHTVNMFESIMCSLYSLNILLQNI